MKCRQVRKKLSAFEDHELAPSRRRQIREHLAVCPRCRREYREMEQLRELLTPLPPCPPGPSMADLVMERIWRPRTGGSWQPVIQMGVYLTTLLVFLAVILVFNGTPPDAGKNPLHLKDPTMLSLVIDKETTSVVHVSQDLFDSVLTEEGIHER